MHYVQRRGIARPGGDPPTWISASLVFQPQWSPAFWQLASSRLPNPGVRWYTSPPPDLGWIFKNVPPPPTFDQAWTPAFGELLASFRARSRPFWFEPTPASDAWRFAALPGLSFNAAWMPAVQQLSSSFRLPPGRRWFEPVQPPTSWCITPLQTSIRVFMAAQSVAQSYRARRGVPWYTPPPPQIGWWAAVVSLAPPPSPIGDTFGADPWLLDITGIAQGFSTRDLDALELFYDGRIVNEPIVTRRMVDTFWGPVQFDNLEIDLSIADNPSFAAQDLRNVGFKLRRVDIVSLATQLEYTGVIAQTRRSRGVITIEGASLDLSALAQNIPTDTVDTKRFPAAVDVGAVIPFTVGTVPGVPLRYIYEDLVNSLFYYVVGATIASNVAGEPHQFAGIDNVWRLGPNNTRFLVSPSECLKSNGAPAATWDEAMLFSNPFSGYIALRFALRQTDTSGNLYPLVADLRGWMAGRNPARLVMTLLNGFPFLSKATNIASFVRGIRDAAFDYVGLVLPDAPTCLLMFNDPSGRDGETAYDSSGRLRHGFYSINISVDGLFGPMAGGMSAYSTDGRALRLQGIAGEYVEVDSDELVPSPVTNALSMEIWYAPSNTFGDMMTVVSRPICEKSIGDVVNTCALLFQSAGLITWRVVTGTGAHDVSLPLSPSDADHWLHIVGVAAGGTMTLYITRSDATTGTPGATALSSSGYTGTIATGSGPVYVGRFAGGVGNAGNGAFDNFAFYRYALNSTNVAEHAWGRTKPPQWPKIPNFFDGIIDGDLGTFAAHYWRLGVRSSGLDDLIGNWTLVDVGAVPIVEGALSKRGWRHGDKASRYANNLAIYTKTSISHTMFFWQSFGGTVACWYKPDVQFVLSGIAEKTVAGAINTEWLMFQQNDGTFNFRVAADTSGVNYATVATPVLLEDVGRWTFLVGTVSNSVAKLYKNGVLMGQVACSATPSMGDGILLIGALAGPSNPCRGNIDELVIYDGVALSADQVAQLFLWGTWTGGGLLVDGAMTEQKQAQDWLSPLLMMRGMRLLVNEQNEFTIAVDATAAAVALAAGDAAGDGPRTILDVGARQRTRMDDAIKQYLVLYRKNMLTGEFAFTRSRTVNASIGRDKTVEHPFIRDHFTADLVNDYLAKRQQFGEETLEATLTSDAVLLAEGNLVTVNDPAMGLTGQTFEVIAMRKHLDITDVTLAGWDGSIYLYTATAFPIGAQPG